MFRIIFTIACLLLVVHSQPACRFAHQFTKQDLLLNKSRQEEYINNVMYWEGKFHQDGIGINYASGLTYDGHPLNYTSGEIQGDPHFFSAASKESIHISLLALIINGDSRAQLLISTNQTEAIRVAVELLTNKITSYEKFNKQFPGYGGFIPWYTANASGLFPPDTDYNVPSLDNGELLWAMTAVIDVLKGQNLTDLATRYQNHLDIMTKFALTVFYEGNGNVRTVAVIKDPFAAPTPDNYKIICPTCFLNDPYEGELFTIYITLFCGISQAEQDLIWKNKMGMLQSVDYRIGVSSQYITVEKGFWYSAHEKWKFLMLPYTDVDILKRVFRNGERARTLHSDLHRIPGMYASINDVSPNITIPGYISAAGIPSIAFNPTDRTDVITAYSTFPLFLIDTATALLWYDNFLKGPKCQNPYGATEAININGTLISPLATWDSKMTTVLAMLGGVVDINRRILKERDLYHNFTSKIQEVYQSVFPSLKGEDIPFGLPTKSIPVNVLKDFDSCKLAVDSEDSIVINI